MNPHSLEQTMSIGTHERKALRKRLAQIDVAIGHPGRSVEQLAALNRERLSLEHALAADSSDE